VNTESIDCRKVQFGVENIETGRNDGMEKVGDFCFDESFTHIYIWLPGDRQGPSAIQINKGAALGERVWGWDGNVDKPTLTPSIHSPGQWHGFLRDGRLVSC